jgi:hypothetical protein
MWNNTIILFLGDNGAPSNNAGSNGIFKGMKFGHWEGGHRVPGFIATGGGPTGVAGVLPAALVGQWHNGTTHLVDYHATVLDLAGVRTAAQPAGVPVVDGFSIRAVLNATEPLGSPIRSELWISDDVLRVGSMKLITAAGTQSTSLMLGLGTCPFGVFRMLFRAHVVPCACGVVHMSCRAHVLPCACPAVHMSCRAHVLPCTCRVVQMSCCPQCLGQHPFRSGVATFPSVRHCLTRWW